MVRPEVDCTVSSKKKRCRTRVNIPNADATVGVSGGENEVLAEVETSPVLALRRFDQLALGRAAAETGRVNGRAGVDAYHLALDFVALIVRIVQRQPVPVQMHPFSSRTCDTPT